MLGRNRCMFRDYHNGGINGADSNGELANVKEAIRRNPETDYPLLLVLELVGNDVCHRDLNKLTTPEKFRSNILEILAYLDTTLPAGSHVLTIGLADGRVLYDTLHDKLHPMGVPYPDVYEYLICLDASPCPGWLTTNATARNFTSDRAANLSKVYQDLL
mmetsp:Transcript_16051/g.13580  ORF Transcript_16051/g.13580 Transcript_16051/m.13580 type:complete len:160 (+) Transcript_16051:1012-1491(+)